VRRHVGRRCSFRHIRIAVEKIRSSLRGRRTKREGVISRDPVFGRVVMRCGGSGLKLNQVGTIASSAFWVRGILKGRFDDYLTRFRNMRYRQQRCHGRRRCGRGCDIRSAVLQLWSRLYSRRFTVRSFDSDHRPPPHQLAIQICRSSTRHSFGNRSSAHSHRDDLIWTD
jgi:hypothetical protein